MKVLLVDDNRDIIELLTKALSVKVQEIRTATNGKDGLELIKNEEWDLVLLDLAMPGFSGLDVINNLEKNNLLKKNIIWVFTASSITNDEEKEFIGRGVSKVIKKPVQIKELFAKLAELKTVQ